MKRIKNINKKEKNKQKAFIGLSIVKYDLEEYYVRQTADFNHKEATIVLHTQRTT